MCLAPFFQKCLTIFYTSLSVYNEKRSTLRYRKTTGSVQVSFAGTQFLTFANLFSLSLFLSLLSRIYPRENLP